MIVIRDITQRSPQWFAEKLGKPSAGSFARIIKSSGAPSSQRDKYLQELVAEIIYGARGEDVETDAMRRGTNLENEAAAFYDMIHNTSHEKVGVVYHDASKRVLCSPDMWFGSYGGEIKCLSDSHHKQILETRRAEGKHWIQVQGSIWICDCDEWPLFYYHPEIEHIEFSVKKDKVFCRKLSDEIEVFLEDLDATIEKIRRG